MRNRPTRGMINILKYKIRQGNYSEHFYVNHFGGKVDYSRFINNYARFLLQ